MKKHLNDFLKQHITNALGKKSNQKIIVIESDDWGTIRMPSVPAYDLLTKKGLDIASHYNRYDSLATEQDLSALFDVLSSFKDAHGNQLAITANCLVANPDFARIRSSNYQQYFFEPFTKTLEESPSCGNSFDLWKEGIKQGLFHPQFHGREHLNISSWMTALQQNNPDALLGFQYGFWGFPIREKNSRRKHYLSAFDFNTQEESNDVCKIAAEGLQLFEEIFDYQSKSFIAPNFVWSPLLEKTLYTHGVTLIQSQRNQLIPVIEASGFQTKFHYTGQRDNVGQRYLVRNAYFEPSSDLSQDWVGSCLQDIDRAFFWKTPAIISSHRVNFIGAIIPDNRKRNLLLFKELIKKILLRWPEVTFMTTDQLD